MLSSKSDGDEYLPYESPSREVSVLQSGEGLFQVGNQVVGVLDAG